MKLSDFTKPFNRGNNHENDLGFGNRVGTSGERLINRDGTYNIVRRGGRGWQPYQNLVEMPWIRFMSFVTLFYFAINAFFALIFVMVGVEHLSGVTTNSTFLDDFAASFYFSVQTFTTVGYGAISPVGPTANLIAAVDALVGLLSFALGTGLLFARFAKPKSNIIFSKKAVIRPYADTPYQSFQFQVVNSRNNKIINLESKVAVTWLEKEGDKARRRFSLLELERERVSLFPLNWVVVHIIDNDSPLWKWKERDYWEKQVEIIILIRGYDETFAQDVHANSSYTCAEIEWNMRFDRIYFPENGYTVIELDRVHDMVPVEEEE